MWLQVAHSSGKEIHKNFFFFCFFIGTANYNKRHAQISKGNAKKNLALR